jgi:anti-sigma factor RsiW
MTCKECREQILLAESDRPLRGTAQEHLEACAACQELVRGDEKLRALVRRLGETEHAPQEFREQIGEVVRGETGHRKRSSRLGVGIAAAVVLVTLAGAGLKWHYSQRSFTPNRLAHEFILDHLNYLPGKEQIVSNSSRDVEQWFQGRVDFPVRVPQLPGTGLEDARVCQIAGRKAALLHYRHNPDGTLVSLFVTVEPKNFEQAGKSMAISSSSHGLNTKLWCHRGLVFSLVAAVDDASLEQIASSVRQQEP